MIGLLMALAAAPSDDRPVWVTPPPPPTRATAVYACKVTNLNDAAFRVEIRVDYGKNPWAPWVSIKSSQERILASMPSTMSLAKPDSLERKVSLKLPDGKWQSMRFLVISSASTVDDVEFYKENNAPSMDGEALNTIFATGICRIKLEENK